VSKVDLHLHTTASDGKFTPAEIVRLAREAGLVYIAICDHDSIDGVMPAREEAVKYPGLTVIGGVEINTDIPAGELHILGYLCDLSNDELKTTLERLRSSRIERAKKMIHKLHKLGVDIDFERVQELAGTGSIGRPHIARAMQEKGYVNSFKDAFLRYISRGCPAYVERDKITPTEATRLILRAHGLPVMAHPLTFQNPEKLIGQCQAVGLAGLEVYYGSYTQEQIHTLLQIAGRYGLICTGGSDFHGLDSLDELPLGTVDVPLEAALNLIALKDKNGQFQADFGKG
jgi:predicted metal-dependent phosphoesterase TrpH